MARFRTCTTPSASGWLAVPCIAAQLNGCAQRKEPLGDFSAYLQKPLSKASKADAAYPETIRTNASKANAIQVTFLGTTTLLFDDGDTQILIDAFVTRPPFRTVAFDRIGSDENLLKTLLADVDVKRVKAIFVSHSHYDHALDVPSFLKLTNATLYGSESTLNIARGVCLPEHLLMPLTVNRDYRIGEFYVRAIPSRHSPPVPGINNDLGTMIDHALKQPARYHEYREGGSYDFLIHHRGRSMLIKPSAGFVEGALNGKHADVLFLATGAFGQQCETYRAAYYANTVGATRPGLVIQIHWDDFFAPLSDNLPPAKDTVIAWSDLTTRLRADGVGFAILQGRQSMQLFSDDMSNIRPPQTPTDRYRPPSIAVEDPCR